ncbi:MAG: tetratricopeptide repeat protein [Armatimonadota bacterium]|nr:tetratricopeptide repeat protein [Armatimonadota bacterium]
MRDDPTLTVRTLVAMAEVAVLAGNQLEAISLIERAAALAPPDVPAHERDRLLATRFHVYARSGDLAATEQVIAEAMRAGTQAAWQPIALALLRWHQGTFRDSARILERLLRDRPEVAQIEMLHNNLGMAYWAVGQPAIAERWIEHSVRLWHGTGNLFSEALSRSNLGLMRTSLGRYAEARGDLEAARDVALRLGSYTLVADALHRLGTLHRQAGRLGEAVAFQQEALDLMRGVGDLWRLSYIAASAAAALAEAGEVDTAQPLAQEAFDLSVRVGYAFGIPIRHRSMAEVALHAGDREQALRHAADALEASRRYEMAEQLGYSLLLLADCQQRPNGSAARRALTEALEIARRRHLADLRWRAAARLARFGSGRTFGQEAEATLAFLRTRAPAAGSDRPALNRLRREGWKRTEEAVGSGEVRPTGGSDPFEGFPGLFQELPTGSEGRSCPACALVRVTPRPLRWICPDPHADAGSGRCLTQWITPSSCGSGTSPGNPATQLAHFRDRRRHSRASLLHQPRRLSGLPPGPARGRRPLSRPAPEQQRFSKWQGP